jgi:tRNA modification GTPase
MKDDTIYALASGGGRAGVAVVRVSGPAAGETAAAICGIDRKTLAPRRARCVRMIDPATGDALDAGLLIWFPAPASFTGEDVAELHAHGGPAVMAGIFAALGKFPGLRLAEPGEFTRRAFENDKLDLTSAEGLADLVAAETATQRRQALRQLQGELGKIYEGWRARLLRALAHREAAIDFSDEELPPNVDVTAMEQVIDIKREIDKHLADDRRGERLRDGFLIAIIGPPNAGKSTLLNRLARREAAIVSAIAGTTRDVIEVHLDLGGYPVIVADTAGLRDGRDEIEIEGIRRARGKAAEAELRIAVFDGEAWPERDAHTAALVDAATIAVVNKCDLRTPPPPLEVNGHPAIAVSALTGLGLDRLIGQIAKRVAGMAADATSPALAAPLTRARHREALKECQAALARFITADTSAAGGPELAAEDLRLAARALGRITGRVDVEDVLDVIFRDFCIGK